MPHDFVERFATAWSKPTPEGLAGLLHEDVVLYQPHRPPLRGLESVLRENRKLLAWVPGLHSIVKSAHGDDRLLFIEHELTVPVGSRPICIPAVDRFHLEGGLAKERIVYFDRVDMLAGVLRHPSLWAGYLGYRFGA
ncbi:nuclear transport factor 2 family protein [Pendulispora brunnea]|uniref:Nuclear transport factor 2 family protein n=1 Tax=Pendulispora brunnea TaxID=2905690 RepID=A0ABZ2KND0_9BACT